MNQNLKESNQQKHQFKSYYCAGCRQVKPCQLLTGWDSDWKSYCCWCYYESEQQKAEEYSSYEEVLASQQIDREKRLRQLQLLKSYRGCKCGSKEVDAYRLYENNRLICQPCLVKRAGSSTSPISFLEQQKWFKRYWKIELAEWLENYQCLPVNKKCADKWLKDKEHLPNKCDCLEREVQETYLLFANSLKENKEKLEECQCETSPKVRVASDDYTWCGSCDKTIAVASKKRVIKNRNDPRFWGVSSSYKILCLECMGRKFYKRMVEWQRKKWREYVRRGYE